MARYELTDDAWERIVVLLPPTDVPGGQWRDHRRVPNGLFWVLNSGAPGVTCPLATATGKPSTADTVDGPVRHR